MSPYASAKRAPGPVTDRVCGALARRYEIEGLRLTLSSDGLVIEGRVPCYRMKKVAAKAAARRLGVANVVNLLRVMPQRHRRDGQLVHAIRAALAARGDLAKERLAVSARDGVVMLRGLVSSPAARCEAERLAWAVGGMTDVRNGLRVTRPLGPNGWAA